MRSLLSKNPTDAMRELSVALTNGLKSSLAIIVYTLDFIEQAALSKIKQYFSALILTVGSFHKLAPTACSNSFWTEDANCKT